MKYKLYIIIIAFATIFSACKNDPSDEDLTSEIVGTYRGVASLYLTTDSVKDVDNQVVAIEKVDNETVRVVPINYPDESPIDTMVLTASLTPTPFAFIRTEGVMLTFDSEVYSQGIINGTPFLANIAGDLGEHGKYDRRSGNLVFALEIIRDGVAFYELFDGQAQ